MYLCMYNGCTQRQNNRDQKSMVFAARTPDTLCMYKVCMPTRSTITLSYNVQCRCYVLCAYKKLAIIRLHLRVQPCTCMKGLEARISICCFSVSLAIHVLHTS